MRALPSTVAIRDEPIIYSKDIRNSSNYFQREDKTVFLKEKRIRKSRYVLFFPMRLRARRPKSFYYNLSEKSLNALKGKMFEPQSDTVRSFEMSSGDWAIWLAWTMTGRKRNSPLSSNTKPFNEKRTGLHISYS